MRPICLGLAILMGSIFGAHAQESNTPKVGGQGGGTFADACRGSDVLVGFNITQDKAMNTIAAVCRAQEDGKLTGADYGLKTHGEQPTAGGGEQNVRCPHGQAIFGLTIWVNKFNEVDSVSATCVSLLPHSKEHAQLPRTRNGQDVTESAIGCGSGVAIGLNGRSGALIDSIGLKCNEGFPWHSAGH
jgi:hypothetical protein